MVGVAEKLQMTYLAQAKLGRLIAILGDELNNKISDDAQKFGLTAQQISDYEAAREAEKTAIITELVAMMQAYLAEP